MKWQFKIAYPVWRGAGPWPMEIGIAMLLMWTAMGVSKMSEGSAFVSPNFFFGALLERHHNVVIVVLCVIAMSSLAGLFFVWSDRLSEARIFRAIGMIGASAAFAFVAAGFHVMWHWSFGGGAYSLLSWWCFCMGWHIGRDAVDANTRGS